MMARIRTETTLKCYHRPADDRVELKPCSSNPEHQSIVIDEPTEDWEIVGVVVGAMTGPPRQGFPGPMNPAPNGFATRMSGALETATTATSRESVA